MKRAIVHDTDNDGRLSAALVRHFMDSGTLFPIRTHEVDNAFVDSLLSFDEVWVLDVSFTKDQFDRVEKDCMLHWFDHHVSVQDLWGRYSGLQGDGQATVQLLLTSLENKGAPIEQSTQEIVDLVGNYDVWNEVDNFDDVVIPFNIAASQLTVAGWEKLLMDGDYSDILMFGTRLWDQEVVEFMGTGFTVTDNIAYMEGPTFRSGRYAHLMRQTNEDCDALIIKNPKSPGHSIRSISPDFDCLEYIKQNGYKGGGHVKAAGFSKESDL